MAKKKMKKNAKKPAKKKKDPDTVNALPAVTPAGFCCPPDPERTPPLEHIRT